ncbi:MAG: hypothetical protein AAB509_02540 [Patescibacteria group bacterium]
MAKKIYDIKPPKISKKTEDDIKSFIAGEKKTRSKGAVVKKQQQNVRRGKERKFPVGKVLAVAGVLVVILAVYLFFELPKADIQIWPKTDILSYTQTITADKTADLNDSINKVIPAQYLEEGKENSQEFPATGSASNEGKATGTIKIYNKYNPVTAITLKAGTHFLSDSGKYFVTLQKVVVPAAKKSGGKITPGSIDAKVQASESGTSYNIKPAKFSVPKLTGTPYYYSIYAESSAEMTGGYTGKVKKVTDDDIQQAKDVLTKKLLEDAKNALKGNISSEYVLADSAISGEVESFSSSVKAGTVTDNFTYKAKVTARALIFKKSDLDKYAKDYIISQMPDSKTLLEKSHTINYKPKSIDISGGKMVLDIDFSSEIYQNIDKNSLSVSFMGMTASQINNSISSEFGEQVSKTKINLWPFWVAKAPKNQKVINIDLKFE